MLKEFYSPEKGFDQLPPCYLLGHSFGCQIILTGMLKDKHMDGAHSMYKKVFMSNPFFGFYAEKSLLFLIYVVRAINFFMGDAGLCPEEEKTDA